MTVRELIAELETHDPDKAVAVYAEGGAGAVKITGLDSYEDAMVLVTDEPLLEVRRDG